MCLFDFTTGGRKSSDCAHRVFKESVNILRNKLVLFLSPSSTSIAHWLTCWILFVWLLEMFLDEQQIDAVTLCSLKQSYCHNWVARFGRAQILESVGQVCNTLKPMYHKIKIFDLHSICFLVDKGCDVDTVSTVSLACVLLLFGQHMWQFWYNWSYLSVGLNVGPLSLYRDQNQIHVLINHIWKPAVWLQRLHRGSGEMDKLKSFPLQTNRFNMFIRELYRWW